MHSVLVLDLDGTTAPIGRPASARTVKLLKKLERKGYRIVFSSGKPAFYLCGFVRQLGLQEPVLIGETAVRSSSALTCRLPRTSFCPWKKRSEHIWLF